MKAAAAKGRSRPNGAPEEAKKLHSDFNALQRRALELAAKKSALMERLYDSLDGVVRGLDKKLVEFEQHLRAENRWPSVTSNPGNNAPSAATNQHPLGGISRPGNGGEKAESGIVKSLEGNAAGLNTGSGTGLVRGGTAPNTVVIDIDDMIVDPNEPRYCTCNQVSYGEMVACENVDCKYEWFHFQCVGLTGPPRGQWRCPDCKRK
uniref:PHD-type domain-containing protein n=1 Tax=Timspurckia oligopyrenoides TaxID=708627 RepID=A0A7S0ZLN9_9RHOD